MDLRLVKDVFAVVDRIVANDALSWQLKYALVFDGGVKARLDAALTAAGIDVSYYDPDTSYEEDVRAYVEAMRRIVEQLPEEV